MIGIVKVARSDVGHTQGLYEALGEHARLLDYLCSPMEGLSAVVILGDRWEMAHAAVRAVRARVPIVHLHGGEHTPNVIDNCYRHAISQMASIHCVAHEVHRQRLLRMGIDDATIHITGAPGLDRYLGECLLAKIVAQRLNLDVNRSWAIVLLHPTTLRPEDASEEWQQTLAAIGSHQVIFFTPGNDPGGSELRDQMERYVEQNPDVHLVESLDNVMWVSLLRHVNLVVGNSSALVVDCPFLGKRRVEIGRRQEGRERVPYGDGHSIPRILKVLEALQ